MAPLRKSDKTRAPRIIGPGGTGVAYAVVGALALGLALGAEFDLIAFPIARYFPTESYGQTYGVAHGLALIGGAMGPAVSGYLQQMTGGYRVALFANAAWLSIAATLAIRLARMMARANSADQVACE